MAIAVVTITPMTIVEISTASNRRKRAALVRISLLLADSRQMAAYGDRLADFDQRRGTEIDVV